MKFFTLFTALTAVALAQDPAPATPAGEKPAPGKEPAAPVTPAAPEAPASPAAAETPAKEVEKMPAKPGEAPSADKPDLKPAQDDTKPAPAPLKPTAPDLPALPAPSDETDLTKGQPGGRMKPNPEKVPQLLPESVPTNKKPANIMPGSTADRGKTRTTLKPPVSATDLDLRIRFRQAQSRAANEPAISAAWDESRVALTDYDKRAAMKTYFSLLYKRMLVLDKGIAPIVADRQRYNLRRLEQNRIDPTDPLDDAYRMRRD